MIPKHTEFDALQFGIIIINPQARIEYLNTSAQVLLRIPQSHAAEVPLTQWFEMDDTFAQIMQHVELGREDVCKGVLRMIRQGDGSELEVPQLIHVALSAQRLSEDAGERIYILECFDLGAYEQIQQDSQWRAQVQSHQLLMRQLAHEIKNPLGGIRGAAQLLQDELETEQPDLVEYTEMVLEQVDRLKNLVDQFLVPYRQGMAQAVELNIHEVCEKVCKLAQIEFAERIDWQRDYDVSVPNIRGVADYLQQLLLNLMQNAGQAIQRAQPTEPKVILRTRIARNCLINQVTYPMMLEISVIDNGPGVPVEIYDTLFLPMVTQREGGTGLGLSVAMQIAQQHGGNIEVHSRAGRTQMRVLLPIHTGHTGQSTPPHQGEINGQ